MLIFGCFFKHFEKFLSCCVGFFLLVLRETGKERDHNSFGISAWCMFFFSFFTRLWWWNILIQTRLKWFFWFSLYFIQIFQLFFHIPHPLFLTFFLTKSRYSFICFGLVETISFCTENNVISVRFYSHFFSGNYNERLKMQSK